MVTRLVVQSTPNPNALKFVVNVAVKTEGNYTYKSAAACADNPLARAIFEINPHVSEVYFFDNYITVTQDGGADWDELEEKIRSAILTKIPDHDPNFKTEEPRRETTAAAQNTPEVNQINEILDQTVRPALQMDGGDIQVCHYENNVLKVSYQGACGSCPSATMGTLRAVENILRDQFNPDIVVELMDSYA